MKQLNFSFIFQDGPIGRAYLSYFKIKNYLPKKIFYIYKKNFLPKKLNLQIFFKNQNYYPLKFLKEKNILEFCNEVESFFNFEKNFIKQMYEFNLIDFFDGRIIYIPSENVNSKILIDKIVHTEEMNFINTTNQIYKEILDTKKNFYHIHPGYLPTVRGADGTLNSILQYNNYGVSFFKMTEKIDKGEIYLRKNYEFKKFNLSGYKKYNLKDIYRIWFSFFDPILRCKLIQDVIESSFHFKKIDTLAEKSNYYSFLKKDDLKKVFDRIFL
jgi:hypothetical protein